MYGPLIGEKKKQSFINAVHERKGAANKKDEGGNQDMAHIFSVIA